MLYIVHYYYPSSDQALCHSFLRGSHLLSSQLPGEHTGHMASPWCTEPFWNGHYSSIQPHSWSSFYLPTEGWRDESAPSQVELGVGIEPRTCSMMVYCSTNCAIPSGWVIRGAKDSLYVFNALKFNHIMASKV